MMRVFLLIISFLFCFVAHAQRTCGSTDRWNLLIKEDSSLITKSEELEKFTKDFIQNKTMSKTGDSEVMIIPVVFQVVYHKEVENIPEQRIIEQLQVLNRDFNALNEDIINVPEPFQPLIGRLNVKFVLANRDPRGNHTTGIIRTYTDKDTPFKLALDDVKKPSRGGVAPWDTDKYLNIYVCNLESDYLGYSSFASEAGTSSDGFVIGYRYLGYTTGTSYNLGRTATHELGHYFNLRHIWGDRDNCINDDLVEDTPPQFTSSSGNPRFPKLDNCSDTYPGIMFMNYMDYCNDKSLLMFTKGQVDRMEAAIARYRTSLINSSGYVPGVLEGIDYSIAVNNGTRQILCRNDFQPSVAFTSLGDAEITSVKMAFFIDGKLEETMEWEVSLDKYDFVNLDFSPLELEEDVYSLSYGLLEVNGENIEDEENIYALLKIELDGIVLPVEEKFEEEDLSSNNILINNPDGFFTWERSDEGISIEGEHSYVMNNYNYNFNSLGVEPGQYDDIELPLLDFSDYDEVVLTFQLAAAQYSSFDSGTEWDTLQILISTDCMESFDVVYNKSKEDLVTTENPYMSAFVPELKDWRKEEVNLSDYIGNERVKVIIRNISHYQNNIYLDDLNLIGSFATSDKGLLSSRTISLYPNPGSAVVTLSLGNMAIKPKQIIWYNSTGQAIRNFSAATNNLYQMNVSKLPKGLYLVNLLFEDGNTVSKKIIIQ